jgi:hypothetical protein
MDTLRERFAAMLRRRVMGLDAEMGRQEGGQAAIEMATARPDQDPMFPEYNAEIPQNELARMMDPQYGAMQGPATQEFLRAVKGRRRANY